MKKLYESRAFNRIISVLGMELLDENQILFVIVNFVLWTGLTLASTFNGVFIFSSGGSIYDLMLFGAWTYIAIVISGPVVAKITEKTSTQCSFAVGVIIQIIYYLILIIAKEKISSYIVLTGILSGITGIFRDSSMNAMLVQYSTNQTRAALLGAIAVVKAIIALVVPLLGGVFLDFVGGIGGYVILFLVSTTLVAAAMVASLKLPKNNEKKKRGVPFLKSIGAIINNKNLIKVYFGEFFRGVHEGGIGNYISVLIILVATNNTVIGFNSSLSAILALVASLHIPKILRIGNAKKVYLAASVIYCISVIPILFSASIYTLILGSVCNAMLSCYTINSSCMIIYDAIDKEIENVRDRDGYVLMKEIVVNAGRCIPYVAFLFIPAEPQLLVAATFIIGIFLFISVFLFRRVHLSADKKI